MSQSRTRNARLENADVQRFKAEFNKIDKNNDGKISKQELDAFLRTHKDAWFGANKESSDYVFHIMDQNDSGSISFIEYLNIMGASDEDMMRHLFRAMDKKKTGRLTKEQLKTFVRVIGLGKLTNEEAELLFRSADKDGDGSIDYQEFLEQVTKMKY